MAEEMAFRDLLAEFAGVNKTLDRINVNTEISAEAAIEAIKPTDTKKFEESSIGILNKIYNFLTEDGLGPMYQFNVGMLVAIKHSAENISSRSKLIMEDVAEMLIRMNEATEASQMEGKERGKIYMKFEKQFEAILDTNREQKEDLDELVRQKKQKEKMGNMGLLGWAVAIGSALAGMITGFIAEITKQAKMLYTLIKKVFKFDDLIAKLKSIKIGESFENLLTALNDSKFIKGIKLGFEGIKKFGSNLAAQFDELVMAMKQSELVKDIKSVIDGIKKFGANLAKNFEEFMQAAKESPLAKDLEIVANKLKSIGKGISESFTKAINGISEGIEVFATKLESLGATIAESFGKQLEAAAKGFESFGNTMKELFTSVKTFFTESKFIEDIVTTFKSLTTKIEEFTALFSKVKKGEEAVGIFTKAFRSVTKWFEKLKFIGEKFFSIGKVFGELLGKLALPLTIIMSAWDAISGFMDGFKNTKGDMADKVIGGIKEGLSRVVDGLIGGLLDLLKSCVSWIAGKLGFKNVEKFLDSFSFKDLFTKLIGNIVDASVGFFTDIFGSYMKIFDDFKKMLSGKIGIVELIKDALGALIRVLLAPIQAIAKIAGFDITKKALKLLGLPTGDEKGSAGGAPKTVESPSADTTATTPANQIAPAATATTPADQITPTANATSTTPADQIAPAATSTTGAEMNAMQSDTANANAAGSTPVAAPAPAPKGSSVTNNSSSVTYNNNNVPDRTSWMMLPSYAGF